MENLKEILYNNAKINSCEYIVKTYPFLEKTILEAMNEALRIHDVVGRSEQLVCDRCKEQDKEEPTDPYCMECKIEIEQQAN